MKLRDIGLLLAGIALCGVMLSQGTQAQVNGSKLQEQSLGRIGLRVEDFLSEIANENIDAGVESLLTRSPLLKDTKRINQMKDSIRREMPKYGVFMGIERIKLEQIGSNLVRAVYLYECLEYPVVWNFTFYRSEDEGWNVISVQFHVDYDKLPSRSS